MLVVGLVLLLIGWFTGISLLTVLGVILAAVGAVLLIAGAAGSSVGGRRYWW